MNIYRVFYRYSVSLRLIDFGPNPLDLDFIGLGLIVEFFGFMLTWDKTQHNPI